jgi:serine/threonine protein phosphatase PrpC
VLASDGLWDYMSSLDAVTFVRDQLRKHGNTQVYLRHFNSYR